MFIEPITRIFAQIGKAIVTVSTVFIFSLLAYVLFYYWYVPEFIKKNPIYFQHDVVCHQLADKHIDPCLLVYFNLDNVNRDYFFQHGQKYYVDLDLKMPDSPVNQNLGTFMINLKLMDVEDKQVFAVSRPVLLPYQSKTLRLAYQLFFIVPLVLGFTSETHNLHIGLIDDYYNNQRIPFYLVDKIRLEVVTYREIEVIPPSELIITAQMEGVQYLMYFWKYTFGSFIVCIIFSILLFIIVSIKLCSILATANLSDHLYLTGDLIAGEADSSEQSRLETDDPTTTTFTTTAQLDPHQHHHLQQTSFTKADSSSSFDENEDDY